MSAKTTKKGTADAIFSKPANDSILQANPLKILTKVCPAIMFANKRTPKLLPRKQYETNSITTKKGAKASGAHGGSKKLKKCRPWI